MPSISHTFISLLEKEMATHSKSDGEGHLVSFSPWGCKVGHNWVTNTYTHTYWQCCFVVVVIVLAVLCSLNDSSLVEDHTQAPDRKLWSPALWTAREFLITLLWNRSRHLYILQNWNSVPSPVPLNNNSSFLPCFPRPWTRSFLFVSSLLLDYVSYFIQVET